MISDVVTPTVVAAVIWLVAGVVAGIVAGLAVGVAGERLGIESDRRSRLRRRTAVLVGVLILLVGAARLLDPDRSAASATTLVEGITAALPDIIAALLVLVLGLMLAAAVRRVVHGVIRQFSPGLAPLASALVHGILVVLIGLTVAEQVGIRTDAVQALGLILLGTVAVTFALGVGLGSRDLLSAVIAGRYVSRLIQVGDHITVGDVTGVVRRIGIASVQVGAGGTDTEVPHTMLLHDAVSVRRDRIGGRSAQ